MLKRDLQLAGAIAFHGGTMYGKQCHQRKKSERLASWGSWDRSQYVE